jgi:hypothetical protein
MYTFYLSRLIYEWLASHPAWLFASLGVCAVAADLWLFRRFLWRQKPFSIVKGEQTSDYTKPPGLEAGTDGPESIVIVPSKGELEKRQKGFGWLAVFWDAVSLTSRTKSTVSQRRGAAETDKGKNNPPQNDGQTSKDLNLIMNKIEDVRGRAEGAAGTAEKAQIDIGKVRGDLAKLQQEAATAAEVKTLRTNIADTATRIERIVEDQNTSKQAVEKLATELREINTTLSEETAAQGLLLITPKPAPQHWKTLEPKWTLLQRNPALRERLLSMWQSGPVQALGGRYNQLLRLSERQWRTILLQTKDMPMRLTYWRNLHIEAKRQFVGVSNFFKRLQEFDDRSGSSVNGAFDGMTRAEFDFGWSHISDPPPVIVEFPSAQIEKWAALGAQKLMEHWATPVICLYHEIFVVPGFEYGDPASALDESAAMSDADGFLTLAEDDVATAARQLDFEYISITPYQHVSEVTRFLNQPANKYHEWKDWLGRPGTLDATMILRVVKLALKKRASSELIAGASVIIARRMNA